MTVSTSSTAARLVLRIAIGGVLLAHGSQKLFGSFGGGGVTGTGAFFESVGIKPGRQSAIAAGLGEAGGGAAIVLGLATPLGAAAAAATMGVAASQHVKNGFFNTDGRFELPGTLGITSVALLIAGPGSFSLDHLLGNVFNRPWMRVVAGLLIVPAVAAVVIRQRREQATAGEAGGPAGS